MTRVQFVHQYACRDGVVTGGQRFAIEGVPDFNRIYQVPWYKGGEQPLPSPIFNGSGPVTGPPLEAVLIRACDLVRLPLQLANAVRHGKYDEPVTIIVTLHVGYLDKYLIVTAERVNGLCDEISRPDGPAHPWSAWADFYSAQTWDDFVVSGCPAPVPQKPYKLGEAPR